MNNNDTAVTGVRLYVGNLPFSVDGGDLKGFFQDSLGEEAVKEAEVIIDKVRRRSKGYGFVTFSSAEYAEKATSLNGKEMEAKDGSTRPISINPAHDKKPSNGGRDNYRPRRYNDNYGNDRGYDRGYSSDRNDSRGGRNSGGFGRSYGSEGGRSRGSSERDYSYHR